NLTGFTRFVVQAAAICAVLSVFAVITATALSVSENDSRKRLAKSLIVISLVSLAAADYIAGVRTESAIIAPQSNPPAFTITKTLDAIGSSPSESKVTITVTVTGTFNGLTSGEVATTKIVDKNTSEVLAGSASSSTPNGTATVTLTVS